MKRAIKAGVAAVVVAGVLGVGDNAQALRADLWGVIGKAASPTTAPSPTTVPVAKAENQGSAAAGGLLSEGKSILGGVATPTTKPTAGDKTAEATSLLDQAIAYIKANKLDLADKTLAQVEQYKASLPQALQTKLASVRTMLDTARAASVTGISLPRF